MIGGGFPPDISIDEALKRTTRHLESVDIDDPRREARDLLRLALGITLTDLVVNAVRPLGAAGAARIENWLERRMRYEPLTRIAGVRDFYGLTLKLNAATLDPRPDTETLVDAVLEALACAGAAGRSPRILDLGTGTGAILLALLSRMPEAGGLGIDIAPDAVRQARENAQALALADRAEFRTMDLMRGTLSDCPGIPFDVVVSNPPYIPSGDIAGLDLEVRLHDPVVALDGGSDGLDFYRRILLAAPRLLRPHGMLAFEVGFGQAETVIGMMAGAGFEEIGTRLDTGGIKRAVFAILTGPA
jgi:release factor glutamine methyltransferase